jgi:HEAT repeat protein
MNIKTLQDIPPWEWPEGAEKIVLETLTNSRADGSDRLVAAELAGDFAVVNAELVEALLSIVQNSGESDEIRGAAAIAMGPLLEHGDTDGFEDPDYDPIDEATFHQIQEILQKLYARADVPKNVRRRILEASVRAPQEWHDNAVRSAYQSSDQAWKLTAVFSMRWIRGFDEEIMKMLESDNEQIHYEAVCAAGVWGIDASWRHISQLVTSNSTAKPLRLAAIEAAANIRPTEAGAILADLADDEDEEIAEAAYEAMTMADDLDIDEEEDRFI